MRIDYPGTDQKTFTKFENYLKIQIEFSPNKISSGVVLNVGEFLPGVTFEFFISFQNSDAEIRLKNQNQVEIS